GLNLSRIRSSKELLSSGGTASGPVSFMRGADASAGTIKSGGATRRAAKMVVLDVDHPDIEEFVQTKAREEDKIRALRDAGFDMDLGGKDITSVQYQNANNSVRVSDEFMKAVEQGSSFGLRARKDGRVIDTVDARELWTKMATAAWECADPGIQYDDTINDWHTNSETGRITASNPCFPADQRVLTDRGLIAIGDLVRRSALGESFEVYTNDVTSQREPAERVVSTAPTRYMVTGRNEILELRFSDGSRLRCTPNHRLWTVNRGWVQADHLDANDQVARSVQHAARPMASWSLPRAAVDAASATTGRALAEPPDKWDTDIAEYVGWLIGDGCLTSAGAVTVYGSAWEKDVLLPRHLDWVARMTGFRPTPSRQANGTMQLRVMRSAFAGLLEGLGVTRSRAAAKTVPGAIFEAPEEIVTAFLRGLFDADGCVVDQSAKGTRYVGLGSRSEELLLGIQELLGSLGIAACIYAGKAKGDTFGYRRKDGSVVSYGADGPTYDLRVTGRHLAKFAATVGFDHRMKSDKLLRAIAGHTRYSKNDSVRLSGRSPAGFETTYNLTEPRNHSYIVSGIVVANCSEYLSLDNSSCNLASLNLLKFLSDDGTFQAERFAQAVEFVITAMDISICFADFPTEPIAETTRAYRQLGIGYANLGALLMATGHAYDSEGGRAVAAAITSLMTGTAYKRSAELAGIVGPYDGFARNAAAHTRVMRKHAAAADAIRPVGADDEAVLRRAQGAWQECLEVGKVHGWRNAQASVLAPTGCLTGDTVVTTDRGLTRLSELGDVYGDQWQDLEATVSTDAGPRPATRFFVNGEEPTRRITTNGGYSAQGTYAHRMKVVQAGTGEWVWKRLSDITPGDVLPLQLGTLVGSVRRVPLPVLDQASYAGDHSVVVPDVVDADLAELVGYFMGDGSLHAKGIGLCVADTDLDAVGRLSVLAKALFGLEPVVTSQQGYHELNLQSVRLARWWQAAGLAKTLPTDDHAGQGWTPRVPSAVLESNDPQVYAAFLRGLFASQALAPAGSTGIATASAAFAQELRSILLTLAVPTTSQEIVGEAGQVVHRVMLRNPDHANGFEALIGLTSPGYLFEEVVENADGGVQPTYDLSVPSNVTYVANGFISHNTIGLMMDCDTTGVEPDLALVKFKKLVGGGSMQIVNQTVPRALRALGYQDESVEAIVEYIAEHGHVVDAPGLRPEHYGVFDCAMGERSIAPMGHVRMMAAVQPAISGAISKTINLPESATVADVEDVYYQGWTLGLKALAVYRNNSKVGQPLSAKLKDVAAVERVVEVNRPTRKRLPKSRPAITTSFAVGGAEGYMTASSYPDDGLGEVFLKMSKQGSTLAGLMDAFSIAISIALQYGVPLETYVSKFTNMRFEPAGMTDDPDVRLAQSVMDYIFRRLALDHLPLERRAELGIFTSAERAAQVAGTYGTDAAEVDLAELQTTVPVEPPVAPVAAGEEPPAAALPAPRNVGSSTELLEAVLGNTADAPLCFTCGTKMRPAGSCYVCEG
ncbi:MAG: LAGLIDADG family homing endonuclease, partial [Geodermatophilaceae bacterium]